jgi:hypothetical protein
MYGTEAEQEVDREELGLEAEQVEQWNRQGLPAIGLKSMSRCEGPDMALLSPGRGGPGHIEARASGLTGNLRWGLV